MAGTLVAVKCEICDTVTSKPNSLTVKSWGGKSSMMFICDSCGCGIITNIKAFALGPEKLNGT